MMTDEREKENKENIHLEEHWVYLSQLEQVIEYSLESGGNRVIIHILPDPYRFSA